MAVEEMGKEPGNWELYRGIERVEAAIQTISANSVSAAVFAIEKQAIDTRLNLLDKADVEHRNAVSEASKKIDDYQREQDSQRARNRLFVYGIILGPVVAAVVVWLLSGGLSV